MSSSQQLSTVWDSHIPRPDADLETRLRCVLLDFFYPLPPTPIQGPFFTMSFKLCVLIQMLASEFPEYFLDTEPHVHSIRFSIETSLGRADRDLQLDVPMFCIIEAKATAMRAKYTILEGLNSGILFSIQASIVVMWPACVNVAFPVGWGWDSIVSILKHEGGSKYDQVGEERSAFMYDNNLNPG
ncbi:uncharacterized protein LY89DRAFT_788339 [Mollisia scopiformis]|uniref:Uncharacterized protein n=1 Tax=Mollisia scopiformis TaxID=149040 RepID=A0A132BAQ0_MOLSC|nr:uncharacterized protein LY89DRAFT_788339 [Mollisia scopiformis]KUJ09492.1 hypothetical protein LY89DRAFT_788339 [Mollisia scopiformis]